MASLASDVYLPAYEQFEVDAQALSNSVSAACDTGDLGGVRDAWSAASHSWLLTSAFRLGPAGDRRTQNAVTYPADAAKVSEAIQQVTTPEQVADLGSDVKGLEAIGLALENGDREACPYLIGATQLVEDTAAAIVAAWRGDDGYPRDLGTDMGSQDGVEMAINDLKTAVDDLVFFRLAGGLDAPDGETHARAVIESIDRSYRGVDGNGLSSLVASASEAADARMLELLDDLESTPPAESLDVSSELRTLISTEVASLLSATLLLGDGDGDA
jgi:hypothetical protein